MSFSRKLLVMAIFIAPLSINTVFGQPTAVKSDATDAASKTILDKVKKQYDGYGSLESSFKVEIKTAEQSKPETLSGKIYQQGDNFRAEIGKDFTIGNGKIVWQKVESTVQIKDATGKDAEGLMTPKTLMRMYDKKEFTFGVTGEAAEGWSKKASIITGKPNNRRSEFTKIVIAIDQKTNHIVSVTAFDKYQSRTKVNLEQPVLNQKYNASIFTFDKAKYPNLKILDLRKD